MAVCKSNNRKLTGYNKGNIWIQKFKKNSKTKVSFVILATFGEERDLKNLKSCCTSKGLGGARLKSKDTELIFFHLHTKIQKQSQAHSCNLHPLPSEQISIVGLHPFSWLPTLLTFMAPIPITLTLYLILIPLCFLDLPLGKLLQFLLFQNCPCNWNHQLSFFRESL